MSFINKNTRPFYSIPLLLFVLILCAALLASGCTTPEEPGAQEQEPPDGEETEQLEGSVKQDVDFDDPQIIRLEGPNAGFPSPFAHYPRMRGTVMKYIFDSLLEIDEEDYIPWLAKDWEISDNGKEHLVTLRSGVKWQDGEEMTVEDVVFSFEYYQEYPPVFIGEEVMDRDFLISIEAVADNQVKFVTAEPSGTFYSEAGIMRIIPKHIWKDIEDPYEFTEPEAAMGCGPYILTDYSQEHNTYRYEAYEDYWGPDQAVDVLEMIPVSEEVLALESGEIDLSRIPPDVAPRFEENPEFKVETSPAFAGYLLSFNMNDHELFDDNRFRQAFTYAINKEDLIEKTARRGAKPGSPGILPEDHRWYNPQIKHYGYDPEKAEDILKELGVNEEKTFELLVGEGVEVRIGEALKEQLAIVGVDLNIVALDRQSRDSRAFDGEYEIALLAMGSWGLDADWLRIRYASGGDETAGGGSATALLGAGQGFSSEQLDHLFEKQRQKTNPDKRKQIVFEIQELLAETTPEIPLYNGFYYYAYRPDHYGGWIFMFDHPVMEHAKLSFLDRE